MHAFILAHVISVTIYKSFYTINPEVYPAPAAGKCQFLNSL